MVSAMRSTDLVVTARAGQQLQLFAAVIERGLLTYQSMHAAYPGRKLRVLDVQFDIHRKLTDVTSRAQVVGRERRTGPTMVKRGLQRISWYWA